MLASERSQYTLDPSNAIGCHAGALAAGWGRGLVRGGDRLQAFAVLGVLVIALKVIELAAIRVIAISK